MIGYLLSSPSGQPPLPPEGDLKTACMRLIHCDGLQTAHFDAPVTRVIMKRPHDVGVVL